MSIYMNADEMLEYLDLMYDKQDDWREPYNTGVLGAINYVKHRASTIDLVRCAECKKVREDGGHANCGGYLYCRKWKTLVDEDCFCSWGERRE